MPSLRSSIFVFVVGCSSAPSTVSPVGPSPELVSSSPDKASPTSPDAVSPKSGTIPKAKTDWVLAPDDHEALRSLASEAFPAGEVARIERATVGAPFMIPAATVFMKTEARVGELVVARSFKAFREDTLAVYPFLIRDANTSFARGWWRTSKSLIYKEKQLHLERNGKTLVVEIDGDISRAQYRAVIRAFETNQLDTSQLSPRQLKTANEIRRERMVRIKRIDASDAEFFLKPERIPANSTLLLVNFRKSSSAGSYYLLAEKSPGIFALLGASFWIL